MNLRKLMPLLFSSLLLIVVLGPGCSSSEPVVSSGAPGAEAPLKVTCTIGMITDVTRVIGGAQVVVTGLMGPGVDPHLYKATQGDLARLNDADVIYYNGLHLEGRMADTLVKFARRVPTLQVTESIPENLLHEPPEFQGQYDPHVWFDVSLWRYVAERILEDLIERRPQHEAELRANAVAYLAEMDALHRYAQETLQTIPEEARILVTAHDAFGYFGEAYGMEVMGIQGISTASEYGLQDLERLIEILVERKVQAVFVESSVSPKSIEALITGVQAKGHDLKLGGELFSDAMGASGSAEGTYLGMVRHNIDTIAGALK